MSESKLIQNFNTTNHKNSSEEELSLSELLSAIWRRRWIVLLISSLFSACSVFLALNIPNEYKSTAIVSPASSSSGSPFSRISGNLGGVASLAGINLGGGGEDKAVIALEIIKTWGFLEDFIEANNLQVDVFAAKGWSRSTNELVIDEGLYNIATKEWCRDYDASLGQKAEPSSWELYEKLRDRIGVKTDKANGLVSISVEHYSPYLAKEWVDLLVVAINSHIQKRDRKAAQRNIEYLKAKINDTKVSEMQAVFYELIEEQTKKLMLAEVSEGYVFEVISPAKVPEVKSTPRRAAIVVLSTLCGGFFSVLFVLFLFFYSNKELPK